MLHGEMLRMRYGMRIEEMGRREAMPEFGNVQVRKRAAHKEMQTDMLLENGWGNGYLIAWTTAR